MVCDAAELWIELFYFKLIVIDYGASDIFEKHLYNLRM